MAPVLVLLIAVATLLAITVIILGTEHPAGYQGLWSLPLTYAICLIVLFTTLVRKPSVFLMVFISLGFARYGMLPLIISLSGYYGGRSTIVPQPRSFENAMLLMVWELIVATVIIGLLSQKESVRFTTEIAHERKPESKLVYVGYVFLAILILILLPAVRQNISFITPTSQQPDSLGTLELFGVYFTLVVKQLVFLSLVTKARDRHRETGSTAPIVFSFVIAGLNIAIYTGTNRSDVLIVGVATAVTMFWLFGKIILPYLIGLGTLLAVLLSKVTQARDLYVDPNKGQLQSVADILQVYLGGPYNVAIAIETREYFPESSNIAVFMMDIFRPMIGPNLIVRNFDVPYTNIYFNARIFYGTENRSQILPMIGQGYIHFGYILAPILTIVFIWLAFRLNRVVNRTIDAKIYYFVSLALIRLGFLMGQNSMNMINDISMNLFLFLLLYWVARTVGSVEPSKSTNRKFMLRTRLSS